jgi:Transposase DDE domain
MFVRIIKARTKEYAVIIRGYRDKDGKVRHKTVKNLGPVNAHNRQQMLDLGRRLIASSSGHAVISQGADVQEQSRHNWGAPAIIDNLWNRFSLDSLITSHKTRQALKLMMIDRICSPASKFATYNRRARYQGYENVELHNIYRSLDVICEKSEELKSHIYRKQALRGIQDVVFFDVTTLYFESQKADLLRDFGYSKDCKFNEVQIVLCLVIDSTGKPITYEIFPGNTSEGSTLLPILEKFRKQFAINKLIIVADRGIGSEHNLAHIKEAGYE